MLISLMNEVLLLEHDNVLLSATRSFHLMCVFFLGHNQPVIRVFESPPDNQRKFIPFAGPRDVICSFVHGFISEFGNLTRHFEHGRQRVATFCHDLFRLQH